MSTNSDPFAPWNDPMYKNDPFAPHNSPMEGSNPFKPWNSPFGRAEDLTSSEARYYGAHRAPRVEEEDDEDDRRSADCARLKRSCVDW